MALGLACCARVHPDLLIGTDPDCDRCGVAVPDQTGGYRLLTGNEIGVLLLDYLCRRRLQNGTMPENPVAVTTIVSTDMADAVARKYGVELRRTLTGFKFIGEQIGLLEREGHPERFVFGFEESYGYLSGTHVRDKDGVNAVLTSAFPNVLQIGVQQFAALCIFVFNTAFQPAICLLFRSNFTLCAFYRREKSTAHTVLLHLDLPTVR